ncbi:P-loop containing nucleoside triphosphate hydrolase protein [Radiomyces spectabilis]|uniref:P-loop containing nucleoside triphosphate hydrolase protein n=1 Tax=Radiomyces spectabilis TaxID=64574 RepID=UPI00221F804C|nr:P-loop containing nucleoside triphosphate hydrolase protein [Radiomyces spectabilis]KAI8371492.1 P-loop containing nucleoside triphosphate hydrolase protein [Radiomyces spectabilis]
MKRFSNLFTTAIPNKPPEVQEAMVDIPVRIIGARGSGKTTFLYKLYFKYCESQVDRDKPFEVLPTETFNVETISYQNHAFQLWDFSEISASLHYMKHTQVLIFFVDAVEQQKPHVAKKNIENLLWLLDQFAKPLAQAIVITVANKCDAKGAMDVQDIGEMWIKNPSVKSALEGHDWRIFSCDAVSGQGLTTVMDYLVQKLEAKKTRPLSFGSTTQQSTHSSVSQFSLPSSSTASSMPIVARSARCSDLRRPSSLLSDDRDGSCTTYQHDFPSQSKMPVTPWEDVGHPYHLSDHEFYSSFYEGRSFLYFDHYTLLRIAYLTLRHEKRKDATKRLLHRLRRTLRDIELLEQEAFRDAEPMLPENVFHESIRYSETHILFWLQMVSFAMLRHPVLEGEDRGFETFLMQSSELWDGEIWKKYYSAKVYQSEKGINSFLPPDRKPLPNAFRPSSLALKGSGLRIDYQVL